MFFNASFHSVPFIALTTFIIGSLSGAEPGGSVGKIRRKYGAYHVLSDCVPSDQERIRLLRYHTIFTFICPHCNALTWSSAQYLRHLVNHVGLSPEAECAFTLLHVCTLCNTQFPLGTVPDFDSHRRQCPGAALFCNIYPIDAYLVSIHSLVRRDSSPAGDLETLANVAAQANPLPLPTPGQECLVTNRFTLNLFPSSNR